MKRMVLWGTSPYYISKKFLELVKKQVLLGDGGMGTILRKNEKSR